MKDYSKVVDEMYPYVKLMPGETDFCHGYKKAKERLKKRQWKTSTTIFNFDELTNRQVVHIHNHIISGDVSIYFKDEWLTIVQKRLKQLYK